jgi:hypothetical protein
MRPPLPAGLTPRPIEPAAVMPAASAPEPAGEPPSPDAALATMAQRLEAALRRPGPPEPRPAASPVSAPDLAPGAPNGSAELSPDEKSAKSKSVLDSLEEEMASLLGRPPDKQ